MNIRCGLLNLFLCDISKIRRADRAVSPSIIYFYNGKSFFLDCCDEKIYKFVIIANRSIRGDFYIVRAEYYVRGERRGRMPIKN